METRQSQRMNFRTGRSIIEAVRKGKIENINKLLQMWGMGVEITMS